MLSDSNSMTDALLPQNVFFPFIKKITSTLIFATGIFLTILFLADSFGRPSTYALKLERYQSHSDPTDMMLPVSRITSNQLQLDREEGTIQLDFSYDLKKPALLVPYYDGSLSLWLDGKIIKKPSKAELKASSAARLASYFITIDRDILNQAKSLKFLITDSSTIKKRSFLTLSEIYIGEYEELIAVEHRSEIFKKVVKPAIVLNLCLIFLVLIGLILSRILREQVLRLIGIVVFIISLNLGSLAFISPEFGQVHRYAIILTPLGVAYMNMYVSNLVYRRTSPRDRKIILFAIVVTTFGLIINLSGLISISTTAYNVLVSAPILLLGMISIGLRTTIMTIKYKRSDLTIISTLLFVWALAFSHDLLSRLGIFDISLPVSNFSMFLLLLMLGYFFVAKFIETQNSLELANSKMLLALEAQSYELKTEFEAASTLRERDIIARNYERIYDDLHDGVLTYLLSIKTISDGFQGLDANRVATLAQFCLNEVRVILSSGVTGSTPLILNLANLRHNIFDTLPDLGIQTEWDVTCLLNTPPTDLRYNLEIIRIIQEAIHNAVQRASCSTISVIASCSKDDMIGFTITNQGGIPFTNKHKRGFGLKSMKARVERLGGSFLIVPNTGGATLIFEVPLPTRQ